MGALSTGQDARRLRGDGRRLRLGVARQAHGFAPDHFEPFSPDATAWPVLPLHCGKRRICGRGRSGRGRGGEWPQHRTHPSRLNRGAAFLTLSRSVARDLPGMNVRGFLLLTQRFLLAQIRQQALVENRQDF
jgi:hypothetical protein